MPQQTPDPCESVKDDSLTTVLKPVYRAALSKWKLGIREIRFEIGIALLAIIISIVAILLPQIGIEGKTSTLAATLVALTKVAQDYYTRTQLHKESLGKINIHYDFICSRIKASQSVQDPQKKKDKRLVIMRSIKTWCEKTLDDQEKYLCDF